jgi:hypothetical protein
LYSVVKAGLCAVEAGPLCGRIRGEVFAQGLWIAALQGIVELAKRAGLEQGRSLVRRRAEAELERATEAFESFWSETERRYGFARMRDGSSCDDLTAFLAYPLSLQRLGNVENTGLHEMRSLEALNHPDLASDWGLRMFAASSTVYEPSHYNTGSVFPYLNAFAILALYRHSMPTAAYQLLCSQLRLHGFCGLGYVPEHLRGDHAAAPPRGVPHQLFSSTTIVLGTMQGMLGLRPRDHGDQLWCAIKPPPHVDRITVRDYCVGNRRIDVVFHRRRGSARTRLGARFDLRTGDELPILLLGPTPHSSHETLHQGVSELEFEHESYVELIVDSKSPEPGAESSDLRCMSQSPVLLVPAWTWTFCGRAGRSYRVRYFGGANDLFEGATVVAPGEIEVRMPEGDGSPWVSTTVSARRIESVA